ncbi:MAG: polyamine aminopropyltransferase [Desulfobulbaceae bacterium]|nr:polyamine aminopropyltransferase [Desulfobulbaceae bacterium]
MRLAFLASVFVIASCGLAYELVAGALASYLLGDSVTQFSTVIGTYLFAMGIGSWLSKFIVNRLALRFVQIELLVGVLGGISAVSLFMLYAWVDVTFRLALYLMVLLIGILVGLEIPLVMRILRQHVGFRDLVSQVLTFDYLGALAVSLLFPLVLAPHLGLVRSAFLFGLMNVAVSLWTIRLFRNELPVRALLLQCGVAALILAAGFISAERFTSLAEESLYADRIIYTETTPYQRIVVTRWRDDVRLFLNNNLQFSSRDEYRYHEALVHPALATLSHPARVLVLGGGDGLALREILKYPSVTSVTLVDLDPSMTRLFTTHPQISQLNAHAFNSPRVKVINSDALIWLEQDGGRYDFIVADFPDPSNYSVGKLYTEAFYRLLDRHLKDDGLAVIQSTSPMYARQSFWTIVASIEAAGLLASPYHALVPSFGEWGYVIASHRSYQPPSRFAFPLRFLSAETVPQLFSFPPDMARIPCEVNRLNDQSLVRVFEHEWQGVIR